MSCAKVHIFSFSASILSEKKLQIFMPKQHILPKDFGGLGKYAYFCKYNDNE